MEKEFKNQEKIGKKTAKLGIDCDRSLQQFYLPQKSISRVL